MNQGMIAAAVAMFVLPIAFVVCLNFDDIVGAADAGAKPQGTLIYFYSES